MSAGTEAAVVHDRILGIARGEKDFSVTDAAPLRFRPIAGAHAARHHDVRE